jgi:hypothetical protein
MVDLDLMFRNFIFIVTDAAAKGARVHVHGKPFQPGLTFVSGALGVTQSKILLLAILGNTRPD